MWRTPKKLGETVSCGAAIFCLLALLCLMDMVFFLPRMGPMEWSVGQFNDLFDETCLGLCCALAWLASLRLGRLGNRSTQEQYCI